MIKHITYNRGKGQMTVDIDAFVDRQGIRKWNALAKIIRLNCPDEEIAEIVDWLNYRYAAAYADIQYLADLLGRNTSKMLPIS